MRLTSEKGRAPSGAIGKWVGIVKFWTFPISLIPITVGSALALGSASLPLYLLMAVGVVSANFLANVLNDIFDFRHGVDKPTDPAVKMRKHPLVTGAATERDMVAASVLLLAVALLCGALIALYRGPLVLAFGALGALVAFFYTAGGKSLKSMGLGELAVFLTYGPVITCAAYFVQSGGFSSGALAASIPVGIVVMLVLLANNIRDAKADAESGMSTLSVRMGAGRAATLFRALLVLAYLLVAVFALARTIPAASLMALASAPYAFSLSGRITGSKGVPPNSAELVSRLAIVFGALLAVGVAWP